MCEGVKTMPIETPFSVPGAFAATITATVQDQNGVSPATIIRTNQAWAVQVNWQTTGLATGMISGTWHLHAYLESLGPGDDLNLIDPNDLNIPLTPGSSPVNYSARLDVPANTVVAPHSGTLYKLVVTLTYVEPGGNPGPMAGFVEGPVLQFYNP
jgi:hypothetical protein